MRMFAWGQNPFLPCLKVLPPAPSKNRGENGKEPHYLFRSLLMS